MLGAASAGVTSAAASSARVSESRFALSSLELVRPLQLRIRKAETVHSSRFGASADTYVSFSRPRRSYGRRQVLRVSRSPLRLAYLRFEVAGVSGQVAGARLQLYSTGGSGRFQVRSTTGSWDESTVYTAAPRGSRRPVGARSAAQGWTSIDVTRFVTADGQVNFNLQGKTRTRLTFASRESGGKAPRLVIRLRRGGPKSPALPPVVDPDQPGSQTQYKGRVGVSGGFIWYPESEQLAALRTVRADGVTWVREDFHWGAFERSPGVWRWDVGDKMMRSASKAGVNVLGMIGYSADWAASGPTIYHPPRDFSQYANFCKVVLDRYGAGGTFWRENPALEPRPLQAVEIWNEPWHEDFWRPLPDPAAYARLLRAAATNIRQAHPNVQILASGDIFQSRSDTTRSLDWFEPLVKQDPALFRDLVDAYSVHLYVEGRSPQDTLTPQRWRFDRLLLTRGLARMVGAEHPLWITEFGWSTYTAHKEGVSEDTQARYIREALRIAVQDWGSFVPASFVFRYGKGRNDYWGGYALQRPDGTLKPAWDAISTLLR